MEEEEEEEGEGNDRDFGNEEGGNNSEFEIEGEPQVGAEIFHEEAVAYDALKVKSICSSFFVVVLFSPSLFLLV